MSTLLPEHSSRVRRQLKRGDSYFAAGQLQAALAAYEAVLEESPDHPLALLRASMLQLGAGGYARAHALAVRVMRQPITSAAQALELIQQLVLLGLSAPVVEICRLAPPSKWGSAAALARIAQQLSRIGAQDLARDFARAGAERDPAHAPALYMHAHMEVIFGEVEYAAETLERTLRLHDDLIDPHWLLSRLRQPDPGRRIDRIERAFARLPLAGENEAYMAYALHNELHESGEYPRAWQALERACQAKRSTLNYDRKATHALFQQLLQWQPDEVDGGRGYNDRSLRPIFIVGQHRSGTTMVERMLGGHSKISAAGETYDLSSQLRLASGLYNASVADPRIVAMRRTLDYRRIGQGYVDGMRWRSRGRSLVTDKLPSNFLNLGFAAQALPHARFVHVRRNPIDTGLSNLRTLLDQACPYSYDQEEFIEHYGWYRELMAHWKALLGERLLQLDYEDIVDDPVAAARRMAAFCGVDFQFTMVDIGSSKDPVATASSVLVRDGIRRDRGRIWECYAGPLQPLIKAFS